MGAEFNSNRGEYTPLQPFKYWCEKVLPLTYDDSVSYYELLCKVVEYLNYSMDDVTTLNEDMNSLYESYAHLQNYVNTYFDNLDVQEEINNKLDAMALDGTFTTLIRPFIPDAVSTWLEDNVNPVGSAVVVDATLSISGAAADAKVTGDKFTNVKADINAIIGESENLFDANTATDGVRLNAAGGTNEDTISYTSAYIRVYPNRYYMRNSNILDIRHRIAIYNSNGVFISGEIYESNLVKIPANGAFIKICGLITEKNSTEIKMVSANDYKVRQDLANFQSDITEDYSPNNLLNGTTWQSGWVSQTSGIINANDAYTTSGYIEVNGGKYIISSKNNARCEMFTIGVYDSTKTVIPGDGTQADGGQGLSGYFQLPPNAAFVRITYRTSVYSDSIVVSMHDTNVGYETETIVIIKENALFPVYAELNNIKNANRSKWHGKIMASYGDSQTNQNKWQPLVVEALGMTSRKYGISGATMAVRNSNNVGDCLSSNYYLGLLDTFLDEQGFDVILIMGGTNDWRYDGVNFPIADGYKNILIGENTDTNNLTFKGALKAIVKHLQVRYPSKTIVLMSNIGGRSINDPSETPMTDMTAPLVNANGYTQETFAKAAKEIAEYIGIPFIDVYSCGITIYNTAYYLQDGLHINSTTGAKKVANCVINGLNSMQPYN